MTPGELAAELGQLGDDLSNPQELLAEYADEVVENMKANVPVDTGTLRNSIRWGFTGDTQLEFYMREYGFFQNYGVGGSASSPINLVSVPAFGVVQPSSPPYYRFRTRRFGLPSQTFFNFDNIQNTIIEGIASFTADF